MLSISAGIANYDEYPYSFSISQPNITIDNLRYSQSTSKYYQLKYLRNLRSNSLVNFQLGLSLDFFDLPDYMSWDIIENAFFNRSDYGFIYPQNIAIINFEMESAYSFFRNKRVQYFAGLGFGFCLNSDDRFQFRFTNGLSLLSKNKIHSFSIKSSGLFTWFNREYNVLTSVYNNSTGFYDYIDFEVYDYSNGYPIGVEVQYGFKF